MHIRVNGKPVESAGPQSLSELLGGLGLPGGASVAVALNGEVLPRSGWGSVLLKDGDVIEIVQAAAGG